MVACLDFLTITLTAELRFEQLSKAFLGPGGHPTVEISFAIVVHDLSWIAILGTVVTTWTEMAVNNAVESAVKTCAKTTGKLRYDRTPFLHRILRCRPAIFTHFSRHFLRHFSPAFPPGPPLPPPARDTIVTLESFMFVGTEIRGLRVHR